MPNDMPTTWTIDRDRKKPEVAMPAWSVALRRGLRMRCPSCGNVSAFDGYLKVHPECPSCGAPLGRAPSDDAPPYVTLVIVLHVVILTMVLADYDGGMNWITSLFIFVPLTIALLLLLLRPVKGATLAVMLKVNLLRPPKPEMPPGNG